jgi:hypothetical protein
MDQVLTTDTTLTCWQTRVADEDCLLPLFAFPLLRPSSFSQHEVFQNKHFPSRAGNGVPQLLQVISR